jgi:hypothetical protein
VPREAPTKQPDFLSSRATNSSWTSRLADAPAAAGPASPPPGHPQRSPAASPLPSPFANGSAASGSPRPDSPDSQRHPEPPQQQQAQQQQQPQQGSAAQRLTEALQQAAAGPAVTDRSRLEQLAVKQSQKLIPMVALGKGKAPGAGAASANKPPAPSGPVPLGKPQPLQRATSQGPPSSAQPAAAPAAAAPSSGLLTLRLAAPAADGRKGRASFFESLRRRSSASDQSQQAAAAESDLSVAVSELVGLQLVGLSASAQPDDQRMDQTGGAGAGAGAAGSLGSPAGGEAGGRGPLALLGPSEEEERFLRSLGWTEASDEGEDCGLTEEEIAAFRAAAELRARLPSLRGKVPEGAARLGALACGCSGDCSSSDESDGEF